jgi:hypothetical protein
VVSGNWDAILDAIKRERRVAWMLLSNASVVSLDDGILTLRFARDGDVKGFTTSGCDADLQRVLASSFRQRPGSGGRHTRAAERRPRRAGRCGPGPYTDGGGKRGRRRPRQRNGPGGRPPRSGRGGGAPQWRRPA